MATALVKTASNTTASSGSSLTATFSTSTTSGNLIVVCCSSQSGSFPYANHSCSDNKSNTYTSVGSANGWDSGGSNVQIFYAKNITGGSSHTITVSVDTSATISIVAFEISGALTTTGVLGSHNTNTDTSNTHVTTSSVSCSAGSFLVGCITNDAGSPTMTANSPYTQGTGYTTGYPSAPLATEYDANITAASYGADFTIGATGGCGLVFAEFKAGSTTNTYNQTASGGIKVGTNGTAAPTVKYRPTTTGVGVKLAGSATTSLQIGTSGGAIANGTAAPSVRLAKITGSGGAKLAGTATVAYTHPKASFASNGPCGCNTFTVTASGGVRLGGSAVPSGTATFIASGPVRCGGSATVWKNDAYDGLVGYWLLGDSGPSYIDLTSHKLDGTGTPNQPVQTPGLTCLFANSFNGLNEAVLFPADHLDATAPFTINVWVYVESLWAPKTFFSRGIANKTGGNWCVTFGINQVNMLLGSVQWSDSTGNHVTYIQGAATLDRNKWYQVSLVVQPATATSTGSLKTYINGVLDRTVTLTARSLVSTGGTGGQAGRWNTGQWFQGNLQFLSLDSVARDAAWLKALHDNVCNPAFYTITDGVLS